MEHLILWDVNYNLDLVLSKNNFKIFWVDWTDYYPGVQSHDAVKRSPKRKVVMVNWQEYAANIKDLSWADLIICTTTEPIHEPWEQFYEYTKTFFNNENIIFLSGGHIYNDHLPADKVFSPNLFFLSRVALANDPVDYDFTNNRPFLFDALLGQKKPFRIEIFNNLKKLGLLDKSIVSIEDGIYFVDSSIPDYRSPILDQLDDPIILNFKDRNKGNLENLYSANSIEKAFKGVAYSKVWASHVIPVDVYKNSWFSIISETNAVGHDFVTEKTGKCLYAKRIFLCLANVGHLKLLKDHGFKTFDGIIDESYDNEPDLSKKIKMLTEQIEFLSKADPLELYKQAQPILEHNFNLINDMSWQMNNIRNFIKPHVDRLK